MLNHCIGSPARASTTSNKQHSLNANTLPPLPPPTVLCCLDASRTYGSLSSSLFVGASMLPLLCPSINQTNSEEKSQVFYEVTSVLKPNTNSIYFAIVSHFIASRQSFCCASSCWGIIHKHVAWRNGIEWDVGGLANRPMHRPFTSWCVLIGVLCTILLVRCICGFHP